ncbi:MAG: DMT family transporter [Enhydrobacter sp.]|nr:MAG: DMT family transporter [Enhydrobacter sp.]
MDTSSSTLAGIYLRVVALAMFATMDAIVKSLGDGYDTFQVMFFRSVVAMVPLYFLIRGRGGLRRLRSNRPMLQVARILTGFGSLLGFFYVFPRMPLVDAYAISYAAPLFMVALAVPMLGEVVGWRRWSAVAVGFVGVLVILEPWTISIHWMSLIVLVATFSYALSNVLTRLISRYDHDAATIFWFSVVASAASLVAALPNWQWPSPSGWFWLCSLGLIGGTAQILAIRALRLAPASILAPFDYSTIVLAMLFGYLWFHESPSPMVWFGLPLVIGSGFYILHRERIRARQAAIPQVS